MPNNSSPGQTEEEFSQSLSSPGETESSFAASIDKVNQPSPDAYKGAFADHFFSPDQAAGSLLSAFGQGAEDAWGAAPIQNVLKGIDEKSAKDTALTSTVKGWNETYLRPVAALGDAMFATYIAGPMNVLSEAGNALQGKAEELDKQGPVRKFVAPLPGGVGEVLSALNPSEAYPGHPEYGYQGFLPEGLSPHAPEGRKGPFVAEGGSHSDPVELAQKGRAMGATAEGESGYFGTRPVDEDALKGRRAAAEKAGVEPAIPPERPLTDIHEVVSHVAPDLMDEWHEKLAYHDELTKRLGELSYQEDSGTLLGKDSPELAQAKEAWKENYNRLQELHPDVEEAYRHADSIMMSPEEIREAAKGPEKPQEGEEKSPVEDTEERENPREAAAKGFYDEDQGKIQEHQAEALKKAGVPDDQAEAAGALLESHYNARAARFGGKLGTGLDLYNSDAPEVRRATQDEANGKAKSGRTLNQGPSEEKPRLRVARKMSDGSLKIGEPGQLHADLISDEELDRKSVGHVGMQESDMGFATPDGKFLTREEAKQWAIGHHEGINPDVINGGPRDKDKLESTGYEAELKKADLKNRAETELPPHLRDETPGPSVNARGKTFGRRSEAPSEPSYRASGPGVREESRREIESVIAAATRAFHDEFYGPDRFKTISDLDKGRTYHQDLRDKGFYSALGKGVDGLSLKSGTPEQWKNSIDNLKGVKKEEVEWSGVKQFLADKTGPVSKAELQEFLKDNAVQLQEVEKKLPFYGEEPGPNEAKYSSHRLPGGGNYRELLLTLPEQDKTKLPEGWSIYQVPDEIKSNYPPGVTHAVHDEEDYERGLGSSEADAIHNAWSESPPDKQQEFRSDHWDEPNVLSHIRFDDRTGPNGEKILHVAEVQSDWHQQGRKEGYKTDPEFNEASLEDLHLGRHEAGQRWGFTDRRTGAHEVGFGNTMEEARESALRTVNSDLRRATQPGISGVPNAPFKNSWQELSMKRMIRYAAENGYDRLSWDTGETNALRANQALADIKTVSWHPDTKQLIVTDKTGNPHALGQVAKEKLSDFIGKEPTVELLKKTPNEDGKHVLNTEGITVGGKGNRKFYDEILPQFVNKYVRQWGGKVEDTKIEAPKSGLSSRDQSHAWVSSENNDGTFTVYDHNDNPLGNFHTYEEAYDFKENLHMPSGEVDKVPAHSITITQKMKDSVLNDGQPLFQGKGEVLGSLSTVKNGRNVIRLFEKANASTFFHETGHQWLEELIQDARHPDAPEELKRDHQTVRDYLGMKENQVLPTEVQHELFARSFEKYLREGVAPTKELEGIFQKFKQWLTEVYQTLRKLGRAPLNDDLRDVFDRLVAHGGPEETGVKAEADRVSAHPDDESRELQQRARDVGRKRGSRLPPVKGTTGETKPLGLASSLEADAVEREITDSLGPLPGYETRSYKTIASNATLLAARDPDTAFEIGMGRHRAPVGTTPEAVYVAVKNAALQARDYDKLMELKNSRLGADINAMAVRLGSLRDSSASSDPVKLMNMIEKDRGEYFQNQKKLNPTDRSRLSKLSQEQSRRVIDLVKDLRNKEAKMNENTDRKGGSDEEIAYGNAYNTLKDYVTSLAPSKQGFWTRVADYASIPKSMETGFFHLSGPGVQGFGLLASKRYWQGIPKMASYLMKEENYQALRDYIVSHPRYELARSSHLALTELGRKLSLREEEQQSHIADIIMKNISDKTGLPNILRASSRGFNGYLNYIRFQRFVDIVNGHEMLEGDKIKIGSQEAKDYASVVNHFTGRGSIGIDDKYGSSGPVLNLGLFAVRKFLATVAMFNPAYYVSLTPAARMVAMKQMLGSTAIVASMISLAKLSGVPVSVNPLTQDFGQAHVGDTKFDMTFGNASYLRMLSRLAMNEKINNKGELVQFGQGKFPTTRADEVKQFFRGKLAPIAAMTSDWLSGEDPTGREFSLGHEARERLTPIFIKEIIDFWHNDAENTAAYLPGVGALFGLQMHSPLPPQVKMGMTAWGEPVHDWADASRGDLDKEFSKLGLYPSFPGQTIDGVQLTKDEYHDYIALSGQFSSDLISHVIQGDGYQKASSEGKKYLLKTMVGLARTKAQGVIQAHNPKLMTEILMKGVPTGDTAPETSVNPNANEPQTNP